MAIHYNNFFNWRCTFDNFYDGISKLICLQKQNGISLSSSKFMKINEIILAGNNMPCLASFGL